VSTETAVGGTHLAAALDEAKLYLDDNKNADTNAACRKKFVILLTDGEDTLACSGDGTEDQSDQYKRRRESVAYAKKLADAGYKVFVIGFGQNMPDYLRNTLNWMAYYGGTDNPNLANSGSVIGTSAYAISAGLYPSGISSCQAVSTPDPGDGSAVYNTDGTVTLSGTYPLGGYAFFAADADTLAEDLRTAINIIRESTYSFTQASVQSSRTSDENYIYEASFEPILDDPFWHGHLKKYLIKPDGTVGGLVTNGDAAANLEVKDGSLRTMKTYINGSLITFNTSIDPAYFGYNSTDTASRDAVVGYIRGLSPSGGTVYDPDSEAGVGIYKLGDVFRSTPITVATPSYFFNDNRDSCTSCPCTATNTKSQSAFASFRSTHCRASSCSSDSDQAKRLVVVGANDGQLHAFKTMGLSEAWSFIPPNLLPKLNMITHSTHPTTLSHEYYVDGQITVADVWLGTGDGTCKNAADWTTLLVFGEGRGTKPNTWSQSQYCDSYFNSNSMYDSTNYPYYCGYYALNLNDSLNPAYMWHITGSSTDAIEASLGPYFGDAWSKMMIGRVMYNNGTSVVEKWAGFIGAGYNGSTCTVTTSGTNGDCRGKGFFVIDLSNGRILWSFTIGSSDTKTTGKNMKYSVPSDAAIVDIDGDGFVDTAYIGDLGGNIWRSKFCKAADSTSCAITSWSGTRLFDGTTLSPVRLIYSAPAVTRDDLGNIWVYWGTGDKNDPLNISSTYTEKVFGLKDNNPASPYGIDDLKNITTSTFDNTSTAYKGYYINLATGEKMLAEPVAFGGVIYFTTYTPPGTSTTSCTQNGTAKLYGINYTTGAGVFDNGNRSINIGSGIPSAPVVSMEPGGTGIADIYVTVSGGYLDTGKNTGRVNFNTPGGPSNMTNILFWKDRRLE
jgi:Tfp pilus tip-associated adhesin PilY1